MCAQILVTMISSAQCTPAQPVKRPCQAMQHIIVWKSNVVSVFDGDTPTTSAIFGFVEDAIPQDMWSVTAQSTHLPNCSLTALMGELTQMMTFSTPLWMTTREVRYIKPGAQMYKGGNVTIFFLSHVFFLISIVQYPYFRFAPSHEETDHCLLTFSLYSSPFIFPL